MPRQVGSLSMIIHADCDTGNASGSQHRTEFVHAACKSSLQAPDQSGFHDLPLMNCPSIQDNYGICDQSVF